MVTSTLTTPGISNPLSSATSANAANAALLNNPASSSTASSSAAGPSSSASGSTTTNSGLSLTPTDFVNLMITQLKNQDPTQPTSNADLLQEMSQIGQLQSQTTLQTSLQSMVLQNQIGSASNFIGKSVTGLDTNNNTINGVVDSVHVENGGVNLVLDNGSTLALSNLTDVNSGTTSTTATSATSVMPVTSAVGTSTGTSTSTTTGG